MPPYATQLAPSSLVASVRAETRKLQQTSDEALREASLDFGFEFAGSSNFGRTVSKGFGLVVEACRRARGQVHYDVQIAAGIELLNGKICEMKTGEGKTLSALLPLYVTAIQKSGSHLATANDYLAARDAEFACDVFRLLGLSVGTVTGKSSWQERHQAYRCDVTYGTAKEFGFDFLRDEMAVAAGTQTCIPSLANILIDEADSLLIDEARTPLIIGAIDEAKELQRSQVCRWAEKQVGHFAEGNEYRYHEKSRRIEFLPNGVLTLRKLTENEHSRQLSLRELGEYIENAIRVHRDYQRDQRYSVIENEIVIIDEFTGRPAEGRQWQRGIHQAVEAKEQLDVTPRTEQAASVTVQSLVNQYQFVCGMTGTAWASRNEFRRVYKMRVARIPTNRPIDRKQLPTKVFANEESKFLEIANQIKRICRSGRPVLVGTRTLDKSERLSQRLTELQIQHSVLNANQLEKEASLVAEAGQPGRVTVATNMAGRGTDITLHDLVRKAGGLHVILSELHESERIDWQLIGRGARQGDPGSFQFFVSLEDEILSRGFGRKKSDDLFRKYRNRALISPSLFRFFKAAQKRIEAKQLADRLVMLHQDKERNKLYLETGENPHLSPAHG